MADVAAFDWHQAVRDRQILKIRTKRGNHIVGRVTGYLIWTRLVGGVIAHNSVTIRGVCSAAPRRLGWYSCEPVTVSAGTPEATTWVT